MYLSFRLDNDRTATKANPTAISPSQDERDGNHRHVPLTDDLPCEVVETAESEVEKQG
jgi:hypothetical protein